MIILDRIRRLVIAELFCLAMASGASPDWGKWLGQDVRWLIGPEETRQFLALKSDEDKVRFEQGFWAKRDFSPEKAKKQHVRRLQKANALFSGLESGCLTDRGHLFILYGPPNWVSSGKRLVWHYNFVDGVGRNLDIPFSYERASNDWIVALTDDEKAFLFYQPDPMSLEDSILLLQAAKRSQIRQRE